MSGLNDNACGMASKQPLSAEMICEMENLDERLSRLIEITEGKLSSVYISEEEPPSNIEKSPIAEYPRLFDEMRGIIGRCNSRCLKIEGILSKVEL